MGIFLVPGAGDEDLEIQLVSLVRNEDRGVLTSKDR